MTKQKKILKKTLQFCASMKVALFCLGALFILVIAGTLAQVKIGIFLATKTYFSSFWVYVYPFGIKTPIFPGGMSIGLILLINLIAAHFTRLTLSFKKAGIWLIHLGLIIMIIGGGLTAFFAQESQMIIKEGEIKNYSEDYNSFALSFTVPFSETEDKLITFPKELIKIDQVLTHPDLPFDIKILAVYPNSQLIKLSDERVAFSGLGRYETASPLGIVTQDKYRNVPSVVFSVENTQNSSMWLASTGTESDQFIPNSPIHFKLHYKRIYTPYQIKLLDFIHQKYQRTDIPQNFESRIQLLEDNASPKEISISMNKPLRYEGKTYFQASFGDEDKTSVLQVVDNPGWLVPYISSILMSIGMLYQFIFSLWQHSQRRMKKA